ncbi:DUF7522 family protein [Haloarcula salinisoli]|uniref:Uncharacterized protein n=1 Tax=Haloarcula salinisoli TaxID=2487746 RepID=A0A8J7YD76_9EURY|nr:hypothetical protein [Halomicroarcula salinisoli]MBX0285145.1 hypothetical protein [Halomicroarcula salinisoli]MBX0303377.1 hypothetical protein [Halomicroarcula salinisoli]
MALLEALQNEVGDNLRAVATYEEKEWEIIYEREDIEAKPRIFEKIHRELILEGMGTEYLEEVFGVGDLNCTMHSFEEAMCFHFVRGSLQGVFISIEPDAMVPLEEFVTICKESEIEPPR